MFQSFLTLHWEPARPTVFPGNHAVILFIVHCVQVALKPISLGGNQLLRIPGGEPARWCRWETEHRTAASQHPRVGRARDTPQKSSSTFLQLPSGHSSCCFLRSLSLLALFRVLPLWGRVVFQIPFSSGCWPCHRSREKSELMAPPSLLSSSSCSPTYPSRQSLLIWGSSEPASSCSLIASPTYPSRQSLLIWGSSESARQKGAEVTPFPAPRSLLFNQLPRGG